MLTWPENMSTGPQESPGLLKIEVFIYLSYKFCKLITIDVEAFLKDQKHWP